MDFLDSCAVVRLLSPNRKLAFTSISGSDWHTDKQKVYNWPSNKSDLRQHHHRLASSRSSHAIRKFIGIISGPRTTTTAQPPWHTCDRPPSDRWWFPTDWRPKYDLGATASSYLCHSAKVCIWWKLQELVTDLRACRTTYEAPEWITTNLQKLATKGGSSCELGQSQMELTSSTTVFDG